MGRSSLTDDADAIEPTPLGIPGGRLVFRYRPSRFKKMFARSECCGYLTAIATACRPHIDHRLAKVAHPGNAAGAHLPVVGAVPIEGA
jgi:hypothetical protein